MLRIGFMELAEKKLCDDFCSFFGGLAWNRDYLF